MSDARRTRRANRLLPEGPLAYLISFRCHGTWLHGDRRGSVDRGHNLPETPTLAPNAALEQWETQRMGHEPVLLDSRGRGVVERAIRTTCAHRGWVLSAVSARTNHVHCVVAGIASPERILNDLKAWSTRALREAALMPLDVIPWARHGSTRYLWTEACVDTAIRYVNEFQDHRDRGPGSEPRPGTREVSEAPGGE